MDAARQTRRTGSSLQQRNMLIIGAIAAAAVVIAVVVIVISSQGSVQVSGLDYSTLPQERLADGGYVLGDPNAPITIVEFADFACPHCQNYAQTMHQFIQDYVVTGKARFEYRLFISGADPAYGTYTAQLAECAGTLQPGGFWQAHDILFELGSKGRFNQTTARTLADRMNLVYADLLSCAEGARQYQADVRFGQGLGIQSTPSIMARLGSGSPQFIDAGGRQWNRGAVPYEVLQAVVESVQ